LVVPARFVTGFDVVVRGAGRRFRVPLATGVLGAVSSGVATGLGSGIGAEATSLTGSSMRAPAEVTLVVFLFVARLGSVFRSAVDVAESVLGDLLVSGAKDPLKRMR